MNSTRKLWAIWVFLVFGLFNIYGPSLQSYKTAQDPADISAEQIAQRLTPLQVLGILVRGDSDTGRYFAYANAMLGRPYASYYVRKLEDWKFEGRGLDDAKGAVFPIATPPRPLLPWREFSMEYPPGMAIFALAPALLTRDFGVYHLLFCLEMELLLTLTAVCAFRATQRLAPGQGDRMLGFAVAVTAALGFIAVRRYDACVSFSLGLTLLALAARAPAGAGAALGLGVVSKGVPLLFAPLGALFYATERRWREFFVSLAAAALVCGVAAGAYLALAGDHWRDVFAYHGGRPLQIESTYAGLLIFLKAFDPAFVTGSAFTFGSVNIVSPYEALLRPVAETAPLLAFLAIYVWCWRALRAAASDFDRFVALAKAVCAIVVAFSALGKVFSPQYLVWLTPVAAIVSLKSSRAAKLSLFIGLGLTQLEYPYLTTFFIDSLPPVFGLVALLRNGALIFWAAQLLFEAPEVKLGQEDQPSPAAQAA